MARALRTVSLPDVHRPPLATQAGDAVIGLRVTGTALEYPLDDPHAVWWLIGTSPRADIRPPGDPHISANHATIHRHHESLMIVDRSRNGTFVCGNRIDKAFLHPGSLIQIGKTRLVPFSRNTRSLLWPEERLVGDTPVFAEARARALSAARMRRHVLLVGEAGAGKRTFAEAIHQASPAGALPFVVLDGSALADSLGVAVAGAAATGGTVLIDGVDQLDDARRGDLAGFLAELERRPEPFARVIMTATDRAALTDPAWQEVRDRAVAIGVPPLGERVLDVAALAALFVREQLYGAGEQEVAATELAALAGLDWPGNVAQLRLAVRAALADDTRGLSLLSIFGDVEALDRALARALGRALAEAPSSRQAAQALGLPRTSFRRLCAQWGLE